jgi:PAS domain S-box-containing protein
MPNRSVKPRRSTQHEAAPSAQFFRQLTEMAPQMLWTAHRDGSIEYVNGRVCEFHGRSRSQLADWGWRDMVHPDDWERSLALWTRAIKKGQPYEVPCRLRRHDGRFIWHLVSAIPHREAGRIQRWFGTTIEIEGRKRAERLLQKARETLLALVGSRAEGPVATAPLGDRAAPQNEARLRSIMTLSSDFFWETDSEHRFTILELGGRFAPVMFVSTRLGKTRWETPSVLPDGAGWQAHREMLAARLEFRDFETARVGDDGVVHYYSIDGEPVFGERGEFLGYRGVGREITARKLAERALRESDRQFRAFLDSMPGIAWIKDSQFRYLWLSSSYARLHGRSAGEFLGRDDFQVWPENLARQYRKDDERALLVNGPVQFVEQSPFADGSTATWLAVKFPLPDAGGAMGVAGIAFDITNLHADEGSAGVTGKQDPLENLSGRERQVLQLIVNGHTSAEVGERLGLSPKSVDTYRSRLMAKLSIDDLPSLVKFALRHGLTSRR